jgi:glycerol-3-phosphate cytidylyltransferase
VVVYATEKDLLDILYTYPINIRVVGDEYKDKDFTGKNLEHIEMYYNTRRHSFSTTELRKRVIDRYEKEKKS